LPSLPAMPNLPNMPNMPNLPNLPNMPNMPNLPNMPAMPHLPTMPNLELPRFSPYEMVQALSRSLSPMRYYMEGLDMSDLERMGGLPRPPLARRSHSEVPAGTPDDEALEPEEKRPRTTEDLRAAPRFWEGTAVVSSSEEEEEGSGSESEDDEDDDGEDLAEDDGEDEGEDPLALFGHR